MKNYLYVLHATGGDLSKLGKPRETLVNVEDVIQERMPRQPVFHQAVSGLVPRRRRRPVRPRYTEAAPVSWINRKDSELHGVLARFGYHREGQDQNLAQIWKHPQTGHVVKTHAEGGWTHVGSKTGQHGSDLHAHLSKLHPKLKTEDTFVRANVDPAMDIPRHHELLTKHGFQYIDAMPESLEPGNSEFIHSYIHEKDGQVIVSSSGAWNMHLAHAQEESAPPGPGTWLPLQILLQRNYKVVDESLTETTFNVSVGDTFSARDRFQYPGALKTGGGAVMQYYYYRPERYQGMEDERLELPARHPEPRPAEQTIHQVLAGLSVRDAIHDLVHNKETR